jgi:hypothetical protein
VNHRHNLRPFTDRSRDTLDRARSHVTDRKYAASARLEGPLAPVKFGAGQDKTPLIQSNARSGQPIRIRFGADEKE